MSDDNDGRTSAATSDRTAIVVGGTATDSSPPMPEWSPPDGPWCLKQWLPTGPDQTLPYGTVVRSITDQTRVDTCLLGPDHDGDCRGIVGRYLSTDNAMCVGQLQPRNGS